MHCATTQVVMATTHQVVGVFQLCYNLMGPPSHRQSHQPNIAVPGMTVCEAVRQGPMQRVMQENGLESTEQELGGGRGGRSRIGSLEE